MSQPTDTEQLKKRLIKYGPFLAYTALGLLGTGIFSYKIASTRLQNMKTIKTKSRIPVMHKNMKSIAIFGVIGAIIYSYGFYQVIRRMPDSQSTLQQIKDQKFLAQWKRTDPELQDIYILKSMKMFGVAPQLIEKTKEQFKAMGPYRKAEQGAPSFNFQLLKSLLTRLKLEKQHENNSTKAKTESS